jgi:hydrogenase maturation protease
VGDVSQSRIPKVATEELVVRLVGVGNEFRADDGLGICVARELKRRGLPGVDVREHSGEASGLIELLRGTSAAILVDAISSGKPPGTIHRFDTARGPVSPALFRFSTHGFGVSEGIETARALGLLPPVTILFGIEGETFIRTVGLSDAVVRNVPSLLAMIEEEIEHLLVH